MNIYIQFTLFSSSGYIQQLEVFWGVQIQFSGTGIYMQELTTVCDINNIWIT
jgi:hypothetical protein